MTLPYAVEYLLTLPLSKGNRLCYAGMTHLLIPAFPANSSLYLTGTPIGTTYALIGYYSKFSSQMVPNAYFASAQQYGSQQFGSTLTRAGLDFPLESFAVITYSEPAHEIIRNQTALLQYYEFLYSYLLFATEEHYMQAITLLEKRGTTAKSEIEYQKIRQLLEVMTSYRPPSEYQYQGGANGV